MRMRKKEEILLRAESASCRAEEYRALAEYARTSAGTALWLRLAADNDRLAENYVRMLTTWPGEP